MEEERRLAFVAYTRAERQLYLTESEGSASGYGFRFPSSFIFNVDKKYLSESFILDHMKDIELAAQANEDAIERL